MRRALVLGFACVLLAVSAHAGNVQWVQVKSPNFTVITDAGEKKGRETALHFEQMRAVFGTLFSKANIVSSQPLYIVAFRNTKEFRAVCPLWNGKPEELAGYFQKGNGVTYIALDLGAENKWETVFHEYGHFLLNSNTQEELPPWFDEGFAEYFSTVRIEGKNFIFGDIPEGESAVLQGYKWLPLEQLFSVKHDSPYYNERNQQTIFYAESWLAMAHYWFNSTPEKQKQVVEMLTLQSAGIPMDHAIQQAFGMDTKAINKDLNVFYATGKVRVARAGMPAALDNVAMTAAPLDDIDGRARVAELKLQSKDHRGEAVQEFEEIVKETPDHAVALRGLAYAALQSGDKTKAADYFRRAAALQSEDAHIYFFSAALLWQLDEQRDPAMLDEMVKDLQHAVQLDPSYADAYGWLGLAYTRQGKHDEAIAPAEKAVQLSPRDDQWAINLAGDYGNVKRFDDALKLLQRLTKSTNSMIAQQASSMYSSMKTYQAQMAEYEKWQKDRDAEKAAAKEAEAHTAKDDSAPSDGGKAPVLQHRVTTSGHMSDSAVLNFFAGTLKKVSCSGKHATFVVTGGNGLTLVAPDLEQVSFSGKQAFSCDMHDLKVQGFYSKKAGTNQIVALEVQDDQGKGK